MDFAKVLAILILTAAGVVFGVLYALAITAPLVWAWNEFAVPVFKLPSVSFGQAFAALVLIQLVKSAFKGLEVEMKFRKD